MFWKKSEETTPAGVFKPAAPSGPRVRRRSSGWKTTLDFLKETDGAVVMDVGPTSPSNVNFLTTLGCSIYLPDPLHDIATGQLRGALGGEDLIERDAAIGSFLAESFSFSGRIFDCVLLWDTLDYLPEPLIQPLVDRVFEVMRPGGRVLSFYHSTVEGAGGHRRYHVTDTAEVEGQAGAGYPQLRVLQNRSVEKIFGAFAASKFALAGDNMREAVFTR